ncbi:MAG: dipeptidase [Candidatus Hydrogenedentes bacterium]|nr:dipeptidase [Candidatus Hydrogenedentota bacterium]
MAFLNDALTHARAHKDRHLAEYRELLAMPSISTLPENKADVERTAEWLAQQLRDLRMEKVSIMPTDCHPVVYGEWLKAPGKPTILIYGHYDVQPVDPLDEWESDPFGAEIRGDYVFARGASDMKGQIFAQLKAMESIAAQGDYPVNVKYLLEGEEEIGSPSLPDFIDSHKELLACDAVLNCDSGIQDKDTPAIIYSLRGLAYFELELRSAEKDLHSGMFGGAVRNPLHVMAELVAALHDADGRVTLPGFYEKVRPLADDERELLQRVPYDEAEWLTMAGATACFGEAGYSTVERIGARPTLEVNGMWGGFTGEGAKTVLPARAHAKISARLVADQDPDAIEGQFRVFLEQHVAEGVTWSLHQHSSGPGSTMDRTSIYMKAAGDALETVYGKQPVFRREGGSVPIVGLLQDKLGVDSVMLGFALPDDGIHGPNERQYIPGFYRGIETYIHYLDLLGR